MMSESLDTFLDSEVKVRCGKFEAKLFHSHDHQDVAADRSGSQVPRRNAHCDLREEESSELVESRRRPGSSSSGGVDDDDDDEDDVFADELLEQGSSSTKPLMYPRRQRSKALARRARRRSRRPLCQCKHCLRTLFYLLLFIVFLLGIALGVVYLMRRLAPEAAPRPDHAVPVCSRLHVEDVWVRAIAKLMTESAFRLVDVNRDGVLDVIFGFATGAEGYNVPAIVCDIYFNGSMPCLGGVMALDGRTGHQLWRHYADSEIFALNCNQDLNGDGIKDCLGAGRVGTFEAVSGWDGSTLWTYDHVSKDKVMNLYTAQFIRDFDGDGVPEILNVHGGDPFGEPGSATRLVGKLLVFSGKDGRVLQNVLVPDGRESYYSPVVYKNMDGLDVVVFGTGGETHPGSLWYIMLTDLYKGDIGRATKIVSNKYKGFMTPPVLVDLTQDGVVDLVFCSYNSTVLAVDGHNFKVLWNFTYPWSETYASPSAGYYNDDDIPDFMVHWQYGPGFPVYYHSVTTVLDGRDGTPLVLPYIRSSVGAQASPLTVSLQGRGNDVFLYWFADCAGHEGEGGEFRFLEGTNVHEQSRSDVCRLRFKREGFSKIFALSNRMEQPGYTVYDSQTRASLERSAWVNTTAETVRFLQAHPEYQSSYDAWQAWADQRDQEHDSLHTHAEIHPSAKPEEHESSTLSQEHRRPTGFRSDEPSGSRVSKGDGGRALPNSPHAARAHPASQRLLPAESDYGDEYDGRAAPLDKDSAWYRDVMALVKEAMAQEAEDVDNKPGKKADSEPGEDEGEGAREPQRKRLIKRHVGMHDEGGLQRLISTGTLAPPLMDSSDPAYAHSMDYVFAVYWFYPAKTKAILPEDQKCIDEKMAQQAVRFNPTSQYYGMDDDGYGHAITHECLEHSDHQLSDSGVYNSEHAYSPYNIHMGQLTVYRVRLTCACAFSQKSCRGFLPYEQQQWPAYMGQNADSHLQPRA